MSPPFVRSSFVTQPAGWHMEEHEHETIELSIVFEGYGTFESGGETYALEGGHIVLIPAHVPHTYSAGESIRFGVLEAGRMPESTLRLFRRLVPDGKSHVLRLPPIAVEQYEVLFRQWLRIVSQPLKDEGATLKTWIDLFVLFIDEYRNDGAYGISVAASADYIRSNLRSELSIAELARQCGLAESTYRTVFKKAYGQSPKQYWQSCRLTEAKWLLRTTDRPIQWIAEQVGYSGVHVFSAWFQRGEGVPPSAWRKLQQGLQPERIDSSKQ